jgi:beta-glucosidase
MNNQYLKWITMVLLFGVFSSSFAQLAPYKNSNLPINVRTTDLLNRMTLEEKFWQLFLIPGNLSIGKEKLQHGIMGFQITDQYNSAQVAEQMLSYNSQNPIVTAERIREINAMQKFFIEETRLGIPIFIVDESLHGLIRYGCTSFPQSIGMAASWNPNLMVQVADAIAAECKMRGVTDILSPVINLASDVRWGRTEETYGECPFLSSTMAVAFVYPFENKGIITTPKHLIANVGDGGRDSYPIYWSEWYLRQTHLLPFEACFKIGGTRSVMSCYNSLNGIACSSNSWLLKDIVKKEFGFKGFVLSDAGAVGGANVLHFTAQDYAESTAQSINGGLDVIFQTSYDHYPLFKEAFDKGMIDPKAIDEAVYRVLSMKFELGLFDHPYLEVPEKDTVTNCRAHRDLCESMAEESFVLLKNENNTLPFQNIKSVALIGYDADTVRLGGYSGPGAQKISILQGMKERFPADIQINFSKGIEELITSDFQMITSDYFPNGLTTDYFNNSNFEGTPVITRKEAQINGSWTLFSPDQKLLPYDQYSIRWQGDLSVPESGTYEIGFEGNDGYRLSINGKILIDNFNKCSFRTLTVPYKFEKNKIYKIVVEYYETAGNARFKMVWNYGIDLKKREKMIQEAVKTAQKSDVAVIVAGIHEGEFQDRAFLNLPGDQEALIQAVAKTGKPVVVLLVGGSAITMESWKDQVNSILMIWYPGDEGGYAVADLLMGKVSPSGKLPITFPIHESQLPLTYNHLPTGRGDDYYNLTGQPLFPFGYGLSYTTFEYSNFHFTKDTIEAKGSLTVTFTIKNTGKYDGAEVVQLYVKDIIASVAQPVLALKGFQKVFLKQGESKQISFEITPQELKILNAQNQWVVEPGDFRIMIGSSSKDLRLKGNITVTP